MGRYLRILLALVLLAAIYYRLGGFEMPPAAEETGQLAAPASELQAIEEPAEAIELAREDEAAPEAVEPDLPPLPELQPVSANLPAQPQQEVVEIQRGESLYLALQRHGLDHLTIMEIVSACKPHTNLKRVQRGDEFPLLKNPDGEFLSLTVPLDAEHYLEVFPAESAMQASVQSLPVERVVRAIRGVIETNLFDALAQSGADLSLADEVASILGWNIDFFRDLRVGDEFALLYEEYQYEGERIRPGQVLACHFTNQGRSYDAYAFENAFELMSYYDGDGDSLERQFLRAPLKYSRISSGFSKRRLHPVTRKVRPHYGVDYVAPTGTPVMATADGVIIERQRDRASGNFVGIRHGNGYESYYLHLSKFASKQRVGDRVKQGDVIGFVGATGWATAAHLDYRIKKGGRWLNPSKLDLPPAEPVSEDRRTEFALNRDRYLRQLTEILGIDIVRANAEDSGATKLGD